MNPNPETMAIIVGGGPAPGINGVISAVTLEAIDRGKRVIGIQDGFKWLVKKDLNHIIPLSIEDVSRIHYRGGSIIGTSRENPTTSQDKMNNVINCLKELGVSFFVTIGGDGTLFTSASIAKCLKGSIRVAHVPKTIDNDLPLPENTPTFGFETARHVGVNIVRNLMEDSITTGQWYIIVTMGRKTGHLAIGIGKSAGATLVIIPEEFKESKVRFSTLCDIIEGAIIKRLSMGRNYGVAILAEGLVEKLDPQEIKDLKDVERDEHGNIRLSEIDIGKELRIALKERLKSRNIGVRVIEKNVGYELRAAPPIPFDLEYTRNLGYGVVKFLLEGGSEAMISYDGGKLKPIPFNDLINPTTGKTKIREVEINSESYEVARNYMIRLEKDDFKDNELISRLAKAGNLNIEEFKKRFEYLVR